MNTRQLTREILSEFCKAIVGHLVAALVIGAVVYILSAPWLLLAAILAVTLVISVVVILVRARRRFIMSIGPQLEGKEYRAEREVRGEPIALQLKSIRRDGHRVTFDIECETNHRTYRAEGTLENNNLTGEYRNKDSNHREVGTFNGMLGSDEEEIGLQIQCAKSKRKRNDLTIPTARYDFLRCDSRAAKDEQGTAPESPPRS